MKNTSTSNEKVTINQQFLVSLNVVNDMLSTHFGNDWHFTISKSPHFISKTVDKHFKNAKAQPNSLQ